jgi:hypothetical protein
MTRAQHASPILAAVRAKIGLQQRGLHQVKLRAAAVNAFDLAGAQLERVDRSEEIAPLEKQQKRVTPPERGARRRATVAREFVGFMMELDIDGR